EGEASLTGESTAFPLISEDAVETAAGALHHGIDQDPAPRRCELEARLVHAGEDSQLGQPLPSAGGTVRAVGSPLDAAHGSAHDSGARTLRPLEADFLYDHRVAFLDEQFHVHDAIVGSEAADPNLREGTAQLLVGLGETIQAARQGRPRPGLAGA